MTTAELTAHLATIDSDEAVILAEGIAGLNEPLPSEEPSRSLVRAMTLLSNEVVRLRAGIKHACENADHGDELHEMLTKLVAR